MKDDEMLSLGIFELKSQNQIDSYEVFYCERCEAGTCERIGRCPKCGGRLLNEKQFEEREDGKKTGLWFFIYGFIYLIFPAIIIVSSKNIAFGDLFMKASETDFMSVSLFTSFFGLPICLFSIGAVVFFLRKDSLAVRLIVLALVIAALLTLDFVVFPGLR